MAEKEKKTLGIPETKGTYQISGIVTGTKKDKFYTDKPTKTNKPFRRINFGVKVDNDATIYVEMNGMEKEFVHFSKTETVDGKKKTDVQKVAWKDRFKFSKEGYKLIGVNTGLKKITDDKGNLVNDKKVFSEYDACKEIADNLKDENSVFIKGKIEYSHFESNGNTKRSVKFIPQQVSLCKNDIDFTKEDYKPVHDFTQVIIFTGITQHTENKEKFVVSAKIIGYSNVEDAEFIVTDKNLANIFRKNLKPFNALKVWGKINVEKDTEQVTETDAWGESNEMEKVNSPTIRELVITGADKNSLDKETYSEDKVAKAIAQINANKRAENEFNASSGDDWGSGAVGDGNAEDDEAW